MTSLKLGSLRPAPSLWMRRHGRGAALAAVLGAAMAFASAADAAEAWPTKPVKILVPFASGGITSVMARIIADHLSKAFGQPFVVDNRPGGGGRIAAAQAARAEPDGYTLVISSVGGFIIQPYFAPDITFDGIADFTHIAYLGGPPGILVVNKDMKVHSLADFTGYVKAQPATLNYGTALTGSHSQLIAELFSRKAGIKLNHVPYRGSAQILTDVMGGHLTAGSLTLGSGAGQVKGGAVATLAITTGKRLSAFPDVPTYEEQGYPGMVASTWFGLSGPAKMPAEIVQRINAETVKALRAPENLARLESEGIDPEPFDAEAFTAFFKAERDRWSPLAEEIAKTVANDHKEGK
jgi:tripartite-type tricarboxylate transporter receptor subunit TctC